MAPLRSLALLTLLVAAISNLVNSDDLDAAKKRYNSHCCVALNCCKEEGTKQLQDMILEQGTDMQEKLNDLQVYMTKCCGAKEGKDGEKMIFNPSATNAECCKTPPGRVDPPATSTESSSGDGAMATFASLGTIACGLLLTAALVLFNAVAAAN